MNKAIFAGVGVMSLALVFEALAVPDACDGGAGELSGANTPTSADVNSRGLTKNDRFGQAVATGDFNGDGKQDVAVGAPGVDDNGGNAGAVYIFFGDVVDLDPAAADVVLVGQGNSDFSGMSLAAGDMDGDGLDDLAVGSDPSRYSSSYAGVVHLVAGADIAAGGTFDMSGADAILTGEANSDEFGAAVALGDVDCDGTLDLIVGAPRNDGGGNDRGAVYVWSGPVFGAQAATSADIKIDGPSDASRFGSAILAGVDVDYDLYDDLVVGARQDSRGAPKAGSSSVFLGRVGFAGNFDADADADAYTVGQIYDRHGYSLANAGDVDGDGSDDIWVGSSQWGGSKKGAAYLMTGADLMTTAAGGATAASTSTATYTGQNANDLAGTAIAGNIDLNGDGVMDAVFGGERGDGAVLQSGRIWVKYGPFANTSEENLRDVADATVDGEAYLDYYGSAIAGADVNSDGYADLVFGAWRARDGGQKKGAAGVFYGGDDLLDETEFYADTDGDGFGDAGNTTLACTVPAGYSTLATDCNDGSNLYYPGAPEGCSDPDYNCDTRTGNVDSDGDGYDACEECDDRFASINPAATEVCGDLLDNNCDGLIDDGSAIDAQRWCGDGDGDGFGNEATCVNACEDPGIFVGNVINIGLDCNDGDPNVNPSVAEVCDLQDNDCDSEVDEADSLDALVWYPDSDGDTHGSYAGSVFACSRPAGHVANSADCDDTNSGIAPGELEICDFNDNNCNGMHYVGGPTPGSDARLSVTGASNRGEFGDVVTFLGDQDADGMDEVVVSAPASSEFSNTGGVVYVHNGNTHGGIWDYSQPRPDGSGNWTTRITTSRARSRLGSSMAQGDVNGDGIMDLVVGAGGTPAPGYQQGAVYVFTGPLAAGDLTIEDATFTIRGSASGAQLGGSVATADLDNDGMDDLILGALGAENGASVVPDQGGAFIFYGSAALVGETNANNADAMLYGAVEDEEFGAAVGNLGDIDGDGFDDIGIGGPKGNALERGAFYIVYGSGTRAAGVTSADVTVSGSGATDWLGLDISGGGDIDGDGLDDAIIGTDDTRAYVLLGSATRPSDNLADNFFDYSLAGPTQTRTGQRVEMVGDVNMDGFADFLVGAHKSDAGANNGGATYLVYGEADFSVYADEDNQILINNIESFARTEGGLPFPVYSASNYGWLHGARIEGVNDGDALGRGLAGGGDFNGDGVFDYIIGAPDHAPDVNVEKVGLAYMFLGGPFGLDDHDEVDPLTMTTYFWDYDADTFLDDGLSTFDSCNLHMPISFRDPENPVARGSVTSPAPLDCDDFDHEIYPGAPERSNDGIDADCDGFDSTNIPPNLNLRITPGIAYTSDDLTAEPNASDGDGDPVTVTYQWYVNGVPLVSETNQVLTSTNHVKHDVVRVEAVADDGREQVPGFSAQVTIRNSEPTLTECRVTPAVGGMTTEWSGVAVGLTDQDTSDIASLSVAYQWFQRIGPVVTEIPGESNQTLAGCVDRNNGGFYDCRRGTILELECAPSDSEGVGSVYTSDPFTIANTAPDITACSIVESSADTTTPLTATSSTYDVDGDLVTVDYEWIINGVDSGITTSILPSSAHEHFDSVQVRCTPTDAAADTGNPVTSSPITIDNTPPGSPVINLEPIAPRSEQDLVTTVITDAPDIDGDTVGYLYTWTQDGAPYANPQATLSYLSTTRAEIWEVTVTANDGFVNGGSDSDFVSIRNTAPTFGSATLTPNAPDTEDDITVVVGTWYDEDGDNQRVIVTWFVNGSEVLSGENEYVLDSSNYVRGDDITAEVTAIDSFDTGNTLTTFVKTIVNATPTAPTISVNPVTPGQDDDLTCTMNVPSIDADGDTVTYTYRWFSDGPNNNITGQTLGSTNTTYAEVWYCTAQPNDSYEDGDLGTSATVTIQDLNAPPAPTVDLTDRYRNEDAFTLGGTCVSGINECNSLTLSCNDGFGTATYNPSCTGNAWSQTLSVTRGRTATCSAICTDIGGNPSLGSNAVTTEVCDPTDVYDQDGLYAAGYGDSGTDPIDEWATMPDTNTVAPTITANILTESDSADWYILRTSDDAVSDAANGVDAYKFEIEMTVGAADYEITVHEGAYNATAECAVQGSYDDYTWDVEDQGDGGHGTPSNLNACSDPGPGGVEGAWTNANRCEDHDRNYFIHVQRALNNNCDPYTLRAYNGRP